MITHEDVTFGGQRDTVVNYRGRTFDYVPRLEERNMEYRIKDRLTIFERPDWKRSVWWTGGPVLDQGSEGACVGFACAGEAAASPMRVRNVTDDTGRSVYHRAKEIDEWEGVDYDGTSVRAGALVMRERKLIKAFNWGKTVDEILLALQTPASEGGGPVVIGCEWREEMYETDSNGGVSIGGDVVGGHAILITGYSPSYHGKRRFRWRNSWSKSYGKAGNGYPTVEQVGEVVFGAGGEACVFSGRSV